MPDSPDIPLPADRLPTDIVASFTPVPRRMDRTNGWKPEVQRRFIEALAETGSVRAACRRVGRSDNGAYQLRRHPQAEEFRRAWDAALDLGIRRIEDAAMDRALYGVQETIHYHGELKGTRLRFNERLVMFMLRNRAPHRFAAGGGAKALNAVGKMELDRLKKQWREEWEQELKQQDSEFTDDLIPRIEMMHRRWYTALSSRARAAYRTFRRIERDDREAGYSAFDEEIAEAEAEYDAGAAALDGGAKIDLLIEAEGYGVEEVLAEDEPDPEPEPAPRIRPLTGDWD